MHIYAYGALSNMVIFDQDVQNISKIQKKLENKFWLNINSRSYLSATRNIM
jgi:hypothetical protein